MAGKYVFLPGVPLDGAPQGNAPQQSPWQTGPLRGTVPLEGDEGWDPHEEHREYEKLKAEFEAAQRELERLRASASSRPAPGKAPAAQPAAQTAPTHRNWREVIVGAEILGKPKSRRR